MRRTPIFRDHTASAAPWVLRRGRLAAVVFLILAAGCAAPGRFLNLLALDEHPPPDSTRYYSVFLIGDAGAPPPQQLPTLRLLERQLHAAGENAAVVFLGDNIYPSGMPPEGSPARVDAEGRIDNQIAAVDSFPGRVVFVPGNHDWGGLGLGGNPAAVIRQERYVETKLDRGNTWLPDGSFPGPAVVELSDSLTLVAIDSQWWLEENKYYGDTGQYFLEQEREFLLELDDVLRRYAHTRLLVVAHHPLFTNGPHGGFYPGGRNPLVSLTRTYLGTPQDLSNYKYRRLKEGLLALFEPHVGLIFAAGHEHTLQYFAHERQHYIVSGSGSKDSYVAEGHGASFVYGDEGFGVLDYYTDGSVWLSFWKPEDDGAGEELLYRTRLEDATNPLVPFRALAAAPDTLVHAGSPPGDGSSLATALDERTDGAGAGLGADSAAVDPDVFRPEVVPDGEAPEAHTPPPAPPAGESVPYAFFDQGTITVRAAPEYDVGGFRRLFLGSHYRDLWAAPVEVPVIDLERTAGGLTPVRRGGGLQTLALHLQGGDGDAYVLRSINKDPGRSVPPYLLDTFAHDIVQDQVSAMHPYGAFTLPRMAEAAGILHTRPTLVYVPDDERLGIYRALFGGTLALFESRPDEDQRDEARFGNAENVVGTTKLLQEITEDNDEFVDQHAFARARLFDMLIGDWDRHADQWRWAAYEPYERDPSLTGEARTQGKIYVPIPRDRDFVYFKFDGLLARLARNSGVPHFRRYTDFFGGFDDLYGLNVNGSPLDRRFTSALTREDWVRIARDLQARLTDEVIDDAMRDVPANAYAIAGERVGAELKARRDALHEAAARYYEMLAHDADVVGSDKHERFEVTRGADGATEVVMYKTLREGDVERLLYRRTFLPSETDEIRIYGLGGDDTFVLQGVPDAGPLVRIVGGYGDDTYRGGSPRTIIYDTETGNTWDVDAATHVRRADDDAHNAYGMGALQKDALAPIFLAGRDADEGVGLGVGLRFTQQGFRKSPYAAQHTLGVAYGTRSRAFHVSYDGRLVGVRGPWDARLSADYYDESRFRHFYGLGNETSLADRDRYRAAVGRFTAAPVLARTYWPFMSVSIGPRFEYASVERYDDGPTAFDPADFTDRYFAGFQAAFDIDGTDSLANTRAGARLQSEIRGLAGVRGTHRFHVRLASALSYFHTFPSRRQTTLAVRVGGAVNVGKFSFFHANTLGGDANLRGFRRTRFAGRGAFYQNVDLRVKLFEFGTYLSRGDLGALVFLDNGRVWADDDASGRWHQGYGGGLWASPFYRLVVTATLARSRENTLFDVSLGFLF